MEGLGEFLRGAGEFMFACVAMYNLFVSRKHQETIENLEKNTNSIKDALIKVTGEAERAKGVIEGKASKGD